MNSVKMAWKRLCSGLLIVALVLSCFPVSAFADFDNTANICIMHKEMNADRTSFSTKALQGSTVDDGNLIPYADSTARYLDWTAAEESLDLWVTSKDMSDDEKDNYNVVPFVTLEGITYYLCQISWADRASTTNATTGTILSAQDIRQAAADESKEVYQFSPSTIDSDPYKPKDETQPTRYYIWYGWTDIAPENWSDTTVTEKKKYTIAYNTELPSDYGKVKAIYPIEKDKETGSEAMRITDNGIALDKITEHLTSADKSKKEGQTFLVGDKIYTDYLLICTDSNGKDIYYDFIGWKPACEEDYLYKGGEYVTASDNLTSEEENTTITFTAQWKEIEPYTPNEEDAPQLDFLLAENGNAAKIEQWVENSDNNTMIDEDSIIHYQATVQMTDSVAAMLDGKVMWDTGFATFDIKVKIDNRLTLAAIGEDGTVSFTFTCPFLEPTAVLVGDEEIAGVTVKSGDNAGEHIITVPAAALMDEKTKGMQPFTIQVQWMKGSRSYKELIEPMTLSGISLKLKEAVTDKENFEIKSTGSVSGTIDFSKTNSRVRFDVAMLNLNTNPAWSKYFGDSSNPAAVVHATQYIDAQFKEELADKPENSHLYGNTVVATYPKYNITVRKEGEGSIEPSGEPSGDVSVWKHNDQIFNITPDTGYHVAAVWVDKKDIPLDSLKEGKYTFTNVTGSHLFFVEFAKDAAEYTITVKAGANGTITLADGSVITDGKVTVKEGNGQTFVIKPDNGYRIKAVTVDGEKVTLDDKNQYTFANIQKDHEISAEFERISSGGSSGGGSSSGGSSSGGSYVPADLNSADHVAYVGGYPDGTVRPETQITRAETAAMLYRLLKAERQTAISTTLHSFNDIPADAWYRQPVASMAKGSYISGYPDGAFGGDRSITRAEFVTMLVRFIGQKEATCSFTDVPQSHWAYGTIATATKAGWVSGYADGTFKPDQFITRAEAMTIINRVLNRGVDGNSKLLNFKAWPDNDSAAWYYYEVIEATNEHVYTGSRPSENWTSLSID